MDQACWYYCCKECALDLAVADEWCKLCFMVYREGFCVELSPEQRLFVGLSQRQIVSISTGNTIQRQTLIASRHELLTSSIFIITSFTKHAALIHTCIDLSTHFITPTFTNIQRTPSAQTHTQHSNNPLTSLIDKRNPRYIHSIFHTTSYNVFAPVFYKLWEGLPGVCTD